MDSAYHFKMQKLFSSPASQNRIRGFPSSVYRLLFLPSSATDTKRSKADLSFSGPCSDDFKYPQPTTLLFDLSARHSLLLQTLLRPANFIAAFNSGEEIGCLGGGNDAFLRDLKCRKDSALKFCFKCRKALENTTDWGARSESKRKPVGWR